MVTFAAHNGPYTAPSVSVVIAPFSFLSLSRFSRQGYAIGPPKQTIYLPPRAHVLVCLPRLRLRGPLSGVWTARERVSGVWVSSDQVEPLPGSTADY